MKELKIPAHLKRVKILWYSKGQNYRYYGNGKLEIIDIPDWEELWIRWYKKECECGSSVKRLAVWKDWKLYEL